MNIPAHKSGTAGQIINAEELDKMSYKSHPKTLGDVIDNVLVSEQRLEKKKLSFAEWCKPEYYTSTAAYYRLEACWRAAQENV